VRAKLVARASEWPHSSVRAHLAGVDDALVSVQPLRDRVANFADLLDTDPDDPELNAIRRNELIGRPLGSPDFLETVSRRLNRAVTPSKRGRKPKAATP
jgi:putative transposase